MSRRAHGLRAWIFQRLTALYLAAYFVFLVTHFICSPPESYSAWTAWVRDPWVTNFGALFIVSVLLHAWVGIRDVLMDYIKPVSVRLMTLALVGMMLLASGLWFVRILMSI